ncbi:MAG: EAL domain-containing protein [Actinomycetota bacterium]
MLLDSGAERSDVRPRPAEPAEPPAILYRPLGSSALDGVVGVRSVIRVRTTDGDLLLDEAASETLVAAGRSAEVDVETFLDAGRRLGEWGTRHPELMVWATVAAQDGVAHLVDAVPAAVGAAAGVRHRLGVRVPLSAVAADDGAAQGFRREGLVVVGRGVDAELLTDLGGLEHLPVDVVELDPELVRRLPDSDEAVEEVSSVLGTAARAGVPTLAAGVDTLETLQIIEGLGVDLVEGALAGLPEQALIIGMLLGQVGVGPGPAGASSLLDSASVGPSR